MNYQEWIVQEATAINSDGCSVVGKFDGQLHEGCCYEHDLGYHYGKDPREAFVIDWASAPAISRADVDRRFRDCNISMSPLGRFSPIAWARWLGVRLGGWRPWRRYRG